MNLTQIIEKLPSPEEYYRKGYFPSTKKYSERYQILRDKYTTKETDYSEYRKQYDTLFIEESQKELGFTIEEIEQVGGEGDSYHIVIMIQLPIENFPDDKIYLKANASYQSYRGVDNWDESWYEVKPTKVTYTEYI